MPVGGRLLHRGKKIDLEDLDHEILSKDDFLKLKKAIIFGSNNYLPQSRDHLRDAWMVLASVLITTRTFNLQQSADSLAKELSTVLFNQLQSPVQTAKSLDNKCSLLPGLVKISASLEDLVKLFENASFAYNHGQSANQGGRDYTLMMLVDMEDKMLKETKKPNYGVYQLQAKGKELTSAFYLNNENITINEEENVKKAINRLAAMLCEVKQIKETVTSKKEDYKKMFENEKAGKEFENSTAKHFQKGRIYTHITATTLSTDTEKGGLTVCIMQIYLLGGKIFDPMRAAKSAIDLQQDRIHLEDVGDYLALLIAAKQPFRLPCSIRRKILEFGNYEWPTYKEKFFLNPANSVLTCTKIPKTRQNPVVGKKEKNKKTPGIKTKNSAPMDKSVIEEDKKMKEARQAWNELKLEIQAKEKKRPHEEEDKEKERERERKKAKKEKKKHKKEGKDRKKDKKEKHAEENSKLRNELKKKESSKEEMSRLSPVAGPSTHC